MSSPYYCHDCEHVAPSLAAACAVVRESIRRTDVDDNPEAQAQFERDYGTDQDVQDHVLSWAYLFEEPTADELKTDPEYAEFIGAWKYVMDHGSYSDES